MDEFSKLREVVNESGLRHEKYPSALYKLSDVEHIVCGHGIKIIDKKELNEKFPKAQTNRQFVFLGINREGVITEQGRTPARVGWDQADGVIDVFFKDKEKLLGYVENGVRIVSSVRQPKF